MKFFIAVSKFKKILPSAYREKYALCQHIKFPVFKSALNYKNWQVPVFQSEATTTKRQL